MTTMTQNSYESRVVVALYLWSRLY